MISKTNYSIDLSKIQEAERLCFKSISKISLNEPTGNFFYDPWKIKQDYIGTVFEEILNSLDEPKGEARIIKLDPGQCYLTHADIDDRWHLSLKSKESFLVNLEKTYLEKLDVDGYWYDMDAGVLHSAVNFSGGPRIQLVVRKLLIQNTLIDPVNVRITLKEFREDYRYQFDHLISPWLNRANKTGIITDFSFENSVVHMKIEKGSIDSLHSKMNNIFQLETF